MWVAKSKIKKTKHYESEVQQINDALDLTVLRSHIFFLISLWGLVPSGHEGTHSQASPFNSDLDHEQKPRVTMKMGQAANLRYRGF